MARRPGDPAPERAIDEQSRDKGYHVFVAVTLGPKPQIGTPEPLFEIPSTAGVDATDHHRVFRDGRRFVVLSDLNESSSDSFITMILNWPFVIAMSLAPGVRLGAYEILTFVGSGGMGEVYRSRDTRLNRGDRPGPRASVGRLWRSCSLGGCGRLPAGSGPVHVTALNVANSRLLIDTSLKLAARSEHADDRLLLTWSVDEAADAFVAAGLVTADEMHAIRADMHRDSHNPDQLILGPRCSWCGLANRNNALGVFLPCRVSAGARRTAPIRDP